MVQISLASAGRAGGCELRAMVSKHGRGRWRKSSADGVLSIVAPLLPRRVGEALRSPLAALVALALTAAADVALALCLFAQLHAWRFPDGALHGCGARAARAALGQTC
jgi:hypothetical protein